MPYKYKNISDRELTLINVGVIKAGETVETAERVDNPNFQLVTEDAQPTVEQPSVVGIESRQPQVITEVTPAETHQNQGVQQ